MPRSSRSLAPTLLGLVAIALSGASPAFAASWTFTDVSTEAGVADGHGYVEKKPNEPMTIAGGAACGDFDGDGWPDLYVVRGTVGPNRLYRNLGDGTFVDVAAAAGVAKLGIYSGPAFADYDGDGSLDLFVGGVSGTNPLLFRNNGDGTFEDVTLSSGLSALGADTFSAAFGDYDRDGHLDLVTTHWFTPAGTAGHLWRNQGDGTFADVDTLAGIVGYEDPLSNFDFTFTANFADLDGDRWPDLLLASDFQNSHVYRNDGDGTFTKTTDLGVITDENGMGATVADYDRDGDLDWFVSSIWEPDPLRWGVSGNRLYRNLGDGTFEDATDHAGVREGWWGWGSSFADFNNDGWLDLIHVNGWKEAPFDTDPCRFFVSNGDETFTEAGTTLGADHSGQGRGVVCFDYDRDGDVDVYLANNNEGATLLRNDGGNALHWLTVKLRENSTNTEGIGARIHLTSGAITQMHEVRSGCNFVSQDPAEAHFGLLAATTVDTLRVEWTTGDVTVLHDVPADQFLVLDQRATAVVEPTVAPRRDVRFLGARPNPFRSETALLFRIARPVSASLHLYDAAGRRVRTLLAGPLAPGEHRVVWDGRSDDGEIVTAGVYVWQLDGAHARLKGKLLRLR